MSEHEGASGEMFRYRRGDELRIYRLHVVANGAELWRVTVRPGEPDLSVMEDAFSSADVAVRFFEEVERTLIVGGWRVEPES